MGFEIIIVKGNKSEEELKRFVEKVKRIYQVTEENITITETNMDGYKKIIDDIKNF